MVVKPWLNHGLITMNCVVEQWYDNHGTAMANEPWFVYRGKSIVPW